MPIHHGWMLVLIGSVLVGLAACGGDDADIGSSDLTSKVDPAPVDPLPEELPTAMQKQRYPYKETTLAAFKKLLATTEWSPAEPPRNPQGMLEAVHQKTGLVFVLIPAGRFQMGSPDGEEGSLEREGPRHLVSVRAFLLSKTECTQQAWEQAGGAGPSDHTGKKRPAVNIPWQRCDIFCKRSGLRLPSEAEWEYACRAGSTTRWSLDDDPTKLSEYAWFVQNRDGQFDRPVGQKLPNPWGLHDVHGNVWEWCEDTWHDSYDEASADGSPWVDGDSPLRVLRGGGYLSPAKDCDSASRGHGHAEGSNSYIGFRPAADLPR